VWSKSEGRWIKAVIGAPKDVREPPPETTAVLVLFKEMVGGRNDAYKWIKCEEVPQYIRARPELKQQAGIMDTMASQNFGTMFENRSAFEKRGADPARQMASMGPLATAMSSVPAERPVELPPAQPAGVMSNIMASVGMGTAMPPSAMMSMASTIDQNSSRLDKRHAGYPMGTMASTIPEEGPAYMSSMMSARGTGQPYDPNVHLHPTMATDPAPHLQPQPEGFMASLMGMGGSLPASMMGSTNGSMISMVENKSPNRTPMGSMTGKGPAPPSNPMASFMSSMGFPPMDQEPRADVTRAMQPRMRMQ